VWQGFQINVGSPFIYDAPLISAEQAVKNNQDLLINAAREQGLAEETKVTGLADGAKNCWSTLSALNPHCQILELILDWFHIAKKFQNVKGALGPAFEKSLDSAKWKLWQVKADAALAKLLLLL